MSRGTKPSTRKPSVVGAEPLEQRHVMAADVAVSFTDGLLRVEGTSGDDAILLRQVGEGVTIDYASGVNTIKQIVVPTGVKGITVDGALGQDLVLLRLGSLANVTLVRGGDGIDQVISRRPVLLDGATSQDVFATLADSSLAQDTSLTLRRSEGPDAVHVAAYSGQQLTSLQTWTIDNRRVDVTFDGTGNTIRDTFVANECRLSEIWTGDGGYRRTVTQPTGDTLQETFTNGVLRLQELRRGSDVTRTAWDAAGCTVRQTIASNQVLLEEVWDAKQGYRRSWTEPNGTAEEEAYEGGVLRLKVSKNGDRQVRNAWDANGTRVQEVYVGTTLVRLNQWESATKRRVTFFAGGTPTKRETFDGTRRILREAWKGDEVWRTAWNDSGDRLTQILRGTVLIREEQEKPSGERQVTEWQGDTRVRTTTDASGNASIECFVGDTLRSRELRPVAGGALVTTFDPASGKRVTESRSNADGTQTQATAWSEGMVVRRTLRNSVLAVRELWKDGGLFRMTRDDAGNVRREVFANADQDSLSEGTKASETVTAVNGDELQTTWGADGSKQTVGMRDGLAVTFEYISGDTRLVAVKGTGGTQQELYKGTMLIERSMGLDDGTYQKRRFTNGQMTYEYCVDSSGRSQETTWAEEYTGNGTLTGMGLVVRRLVSDGGRQLREVHYDAAPWRATAVNEQGASWVQRTLWKGYGSTPGSTYYDEQEFFTNAFGMPLSGNDTRRELRFYDNSKLVYHARILVNEQTAELVKKPSAAWDEMQAGRFGLTSSDDIFALSSSGGTFNLGGVVNYIIGTWKGENPDNPISIDINPLDGLMSGFKTTFADIGHALDVNFRTLQTDISKALGTINFDWLSLPSLDGLKFDHPAFAPLITGSWVPFVNSWSDVGSSFASIDFSLPWKTPEDFGRYVSEKWKTGSDWLAARDVVSKAIVSASGPKADFLDDELRRFEKINEYKELGYSFQQALLLVQLLDSRPPALKDGYLNNYEQFLAEEGQKIYQGYYAGGGTFLDAAGHASLQQSAGENARDRLLKKYGLNYDGSINKGDFYGIPDQFFLGNGSQYQDPRTQQIGSNEVTENWGSVITPKPKDPPKPKDRQQPADNSTPAPDPPVDLEEEKRQRQQANRDRIKTVFSRNVAQVVKQRVDAYAKAKGKEVAAFYDAVEQTIRIGGSFSLGFAEGAVASVEGLRKSIVAALDASTWGGLGAAIRKNGREFMNAKDKAAVIADFGQAAYTSLQDGAVKMIDQWEKAGPEERARMIGTLTGQVAADAVLDSLGSRIMKAAGDVAAVGRKTKTAADKVAEGAEFAALERNVKARVGNQISAADGKTRVRSAMDDLLNENLRRRIRDEAGMNPEHAARLAEFAKKREMVVVMKGANPKSLQYQGRSGYGAKPGDLKLKTNLETGLVTATRKADGTLIDARGKVVAGYAVRNDGWIVGPNGARSNYRLDRGHVVDAKGTKFFSDYDIVSVDEAPYPGSNTWIMVATGDAKTGPGPIINEMNEAILGPNRKSNLVMHGANRENIVKTEGGIYQIATPDIGDSFVVADYDGKVHYLKQAELRDFLTQRGIPWENAGL